MNQFQTIVVALLKNALLPDKNQPAIPDNFDWEAVLKLGHEHQIIPLLYYGIENLCLKIPEGILQKMRQSVLANAIIDETQRYEAGEVIKSFEANHIDYVVLKGTKMKQLYPYTEMRSMGDVDILIRKNQYGQIRPIMQSLGFQEQQETDHEYIWDKRNALHIELHKQLISSRNEDFCGYFGDGWKLAEPQSGSACCYALSDEDDFTYMFAHFAKHYRAAGIGIRHTIDLWVYLRAKQELNHERIRCAFQALGLDLFYENVIRTIQVWFDGQPPDAITECITNKIFNSGSFGVRNAEVISSAIRHLNSVKAFKRAKRERLRRVLFPSHENMCLKYKFLKKAPLLLPVMWMVRIFVAFIFKRETVKEEREKLKMLSTETMDAYQYELSLVSLDFHLKK